MPMLRWLIGILFLLFVLRLVLRFVSGLVQGLRPEGGGRGGRGRGRSTSAVPLARDPVCGTFVVPGRALTLTAGGTLHHFCSETCRQAYERDHASPRPA